MMKGLFKRMGALLVCLLLLAPAAMAEDCFTIDVDTLNLDRLNSDEYVDAALTSGARGVRIRKSVSASSEVAEAVRLTLTQMATQTVLFDKDYGYQSGVFDSGVIYLPYAGDGVSPYLVTLYVGDTVYALPFMHRQARLESNGACTAGVRLRDLDPAQGGDWLMGTMVDLNDLRACGSMSVDICASNSYVIGTADIRLDGSYLSVNLRFSDAADVQLESASLYVAADGQTLGDVSARDLNAGVDVSGASAALVYVPMRVSYDPSGLPDFQYSQDAAYSQQRLWANAHASSADSAASDAFGDSGWNDGGADEGWHDDWSQDQNEGWNDGWSDGWNDGWDDGWEDGW